MVLRIAIVALAFVYGSLAHAEEKPWVVGVSEQQQNDALDLYQEGNEFFEQGLFKQALPKYEQALVLWDHPAIRYNSAVCLFNLDRPVEAYENMTAALRFGDAPLGAELYKQGLNYQKLLSGQIAVIEVTSKQPGVTFSLDGKPLFKSPGTVTRHVAAAEQHQIVASKPGYQTETRPIGRLPAGEKTVIVIELKLLEGSKWKPWAVVAGGAVVGVAGALLFLKSDRDFQAYDDAVAVACPTGCASEEEFRTKAGSKADLKDTAKVERIAAYSAFAIGAVAITTGVVLVLRNRSGSSTLSPAAGPDSVGVTFSALW